MMDDLISRFRDHQIEWLTSHNDIEFCEEEEKLIIGFLKDTAESFMRENQSAQQWIPCSERLPYSQEDVLCDEDGHVILGFYTDEEIGWHDTHSYRIYPTAWMPLPEPYREEDNQCED